MNSYINRKILSFEKGIESMATNIGKWLAYVVIAFVIAFLILAFSSQNILPLFIEWTKNILYIVVGGGIIIYIIIKVILKRR